MTSTRAKQRNASLDVVAGLSSGRIGEGDDLLCSCLQHAKGSFRRPSGSGAPPSDAVANAIIEVARPGHRGALRRGARL